MVGLVVAVFLAIPGLAAADHCRWAIDPGQSGDVISVMNLGPADKVVFSIYSNAGKPALGIFETPIIPVLGRYETTVSALYVAAGVSTSEIQNSWLQASESANGSMRLQVRTGTGSFQPHQTDTDAVGGCNQVGPEIAGLRAADCQWAIDPGKGGDVISLMNIGRGNPATVALYIYDSEGAVLGSFETPIIPKRGRYETKVADLYSAAGVPTSAITNSWIRAAESPYGNMRLQVTTANGAFPPQPMSTTWSGGCYPVTPDI
jgi:hypothetical protein